ncbi:MAG: DinB family protein, partial [Blastocatellia bacterium]
MKRKLLNSIYFVILTVACTTVLFAQVKTDKKKPSAGNQSQAVKEANYMWKRAKKWTLEYVDAMPENAINFKPVPEVRSFAEQMLHLAFWNYGLCESLAGKPS